MSDLKAFFVIKKDMSKVYRCVLYENTSAETPLGTASLYEREDGTFRFDMRTKLSPEYIGKNSDIVLWRAGNNLVRAKTVHQFVDGEYHVYIELNIKPPIDKEDVRTVRRILDKASSFDDIIESL